MSIVGELLSDPGLPGTFIGELDVARADPGMTSDRIPRVGKAVP